MEFCPKPERSPFSAALVVRKPGWRVANGRIDSSSDAVRLPGDSRRRMMRVLCSATKIERGRGRGPGRLDERGKRVDDDVLGPFGEVRGVMSGWGEGELMREEVVS